MSEITKDEIFITLVVSVTESEQIVSVLAATHPELSARIQSHTTPQEQAQKMRFAETGAIAPQ